jgi:hypothetical protein
MTREKLEEFLGKSVLVLLYDGDIFIGMLKKGNSHEVNYYQCAGEDPCWFRCSHVKTVKPL